tara:strand:- start:238 stop:540 length:303 start_codon:yes stop_codon:yes gene_type:complete
MVLRRLLIEYCVLVSGFCETQKISTSGKIPDHVKSLSLAFLQLERCLMKVDLPQTRPPDIQKIPPPFSSHSLKCSGTEQVLKELQVEPEADEFESFLPPL